MNVYSAIYRIYLIVALLLSFILPSDAATIAENGKAMATIVLAEQASLPERTAAYELSTYLNKVTAGRFEIIPESAVNMGGAKIYIGATKFAMDNNVVSEQLKPEEWIIRSIGNDIILTGGQSRGVLYAVYRFLEDYVGVHWWNPWEEHVPNKPTLTIYGLNVKGMPWFRYRDIYTLYGNDAGRFAARNRLNRDGNAKIAAQYGGGLNYGPPDHVHTFYLYIPPATYFNKHPEWFSVIKGKRTGERAQLCLTNSEMRKVFLEKLRFNIRTARQKAKKEELPIPQIFDVSQNDWGGMCQCDECQIIAKAEESEAGPLLYFVNYLADAIKQEYPDIIIGTLAYSMTQKAPKTIKPCDNVIVRLCDTKSNLTKAITDEDNHLFRKNLQHWAKIARNLRVWDYAVTYAPYYGLPLPTVHTYPIDYRFYVTQHVEGVFTEHEYPILADMRDFKIWMMMKLLEDPSRNYDDLVKTFTEGFYGSAGAYIREYFQKLENAASAKNIYITMNASPQHYRYLNLDFILSAQAIFDAAEKAVVSKPVFLQRVRHARLPLDRATVLFYPRLMREWVEDRGHSSESMPLNRDAIAWRYRDTWHAQADIRLPENLRDDAKKAADDEIVTLTALKTNNFRPQKFSALSATIVHDYTANVMRNYKNLSKVVADSESESGITNRLQLPPEIDANSHPIEKYNLEIKWGLYDQDNKRVIGNNRIIMKDVTGPGYNWYKMGTYSISQSTLLYFFWSWIIQVDFADIAHVSKPDETYDVWARIKLEGPAFPYGRAQDKNSISIERVILVKNDLQ